MRDSLGTLRSDFSDDEDDFERESVEEDSVFSKCQSSNSNSHHTLRDQGSNVFSLNLIRTEKEEAPSTEEHLVESTTQSSEESSKGGACKWEDANISLGGSRKGGFKNMKDNLLSLMQELDIPRIEEAGFHKTIRSGNHSNSTLSSLGSMGQASFHLTLRQTEKEEDEQGLQPEMDW